MYDGTYIGFPEGSTKGTTFCLMDYDRTCHVLQYFPFYHCPWQNSALHHVLLSVSTYSNGQIFLGCLFLWFFVHVFLQIKHLVFFLFLIQSLIIGLLQCIIQLFFQLFCMHFQCLSWYRNHPYYVILDLFSGINSFGFCFLVYVIFVSIWFFLNISLQHANTTFHFDNI